MEIGEKIWFQPGPEGTQLHNVALEIEDDQEMKNVRHNRFGPDLGKYKLDTSSILAEK